MTRGGPEVHPLAALFPMLPDEELQVLAEDIRENGLRTPIVRDAEGKILDGRNRLAACKVAGVRPTYTTYDGDPAAFVVSANLNRRHLSKGQAAMLAARVAVISTGPTRREAASLAGVSAGAVSHAATVIQYRPELAERVASGALALHEAYVEAQETRRQKAEAHASRCRTLDAAVFLAEEFAQHPDRAADLVRDYHPHNPASPVTPERLDAAIDGLTHLRKEWA